MDDKLISVIIINHNGKQFLQKCLSSLLATNYPNFEVIFVDNGSSDDSVEYVKSYFKDQRVSFVINDKNRGVPGGRNIGFEKARGAYVVFLDNDTEVEQNWLKELLRVFESDSRIAVAQSKLLRMVERNRFDHAGDYLTPFGFLYERSNQAIDKGQFDKVEDILSAKGAATMIKSSVFKELGMYDDEYFMYQEETDFCFRVRLAGYRVVFAPKSIVWHAFSTPLKEKKEHYSQYVIRYYGCRNYISTLIKNLSFGSLCLILPTHIIMWLILSLIFCFKGRFKDSVWIIQGIFFNLTNLSTHHKKRSVVQKSIRKVRDGTIFKEVMIRKPLSFYLKKARCYIRGVPFE